MYSKMTENAFKALSRLPHCLRDPSRDCCEVFQKYLRMKKGADIQIVQTELLPFRQQASIALASLVLIGPHGAGLTHVAWTSAGAALIEIEIEFRGFWYHNLCRLLGRTHTVVKTRRQHTLGEPEKEKIAAAIEGQLAARGLSGLTLLRGSAAQSGEAYDGSAGRAVDGVTEQRYERDSCTHTAGSSGSQWWRLSLEVAAPIARVMVWNRADCCSEGLQGAKVKAGDELCGELTADTAVQTVACGGKLASTISIETKSSHSIMLCEVEVWTSTMLSNQVPAPHKL